MTAWRPVPTTAWTSFPHPTAVTRASASRQIEFIDSIDAVLLGRVFYQMFAQYWPNASGDEKPFADRINALRKIVFSNSLEHAPWGGYEPAEIIRTSAVKEVEQLKQQMGKDMVVWGSISLAQALMKQGLIDEYHLVVCPVVLGARNVTSSKSHGVSGDMQLLSTRYL